MDDEQLKKYFKWLNAGNSPAEIKNDLIKNGLPGEDAQALMAKIDSLYLDTKIPKDLARETAPRNGVWYRIVGWTVVGLSIVIAVDSILYGTAFGGWFAITAIGGVGFGVIRHGYKIESKNFLNRDKGFRRKFEH